jgi:hypothetical protein
MSTAIHRASVFDSHRSEGCGLADDMRTGVAVWMAADEEALPTALLLRCLVTPLIIYVP